MIQATELRDRPGGDWTASGTLIRMRWFFSTTGLLLLSGCPIEGVDTPPPGVAPPETSAWGDRLTLGSEVLCEAPATGLPGFTDVTEEAGVAFTPVMPEWNEAQNGITSIMLEAVGGFAVADFDDDGWLDIVFTSFMDPPRLYRATGPLRYEEVPTATSGLDITGVHISAVSAVDYDGDGDLDLLFGTSEGARLYANDGAVVFEDVTLSTGLDLPGNFLGAAWADVDLDGDLDPYLPGYGAGSPGPNVPSLPEHDWLLENDDGLFRDRSTTMWPLDLAPGAAFAAGWFDGDGDGLQDLYVANDLGGVGSNAANQYFENLGDWAFTSLRDGADIAMLSMGLALGDMDNDGDVDMHVSNAGPTVLLRNEGDHLFTDVSLQVADFSDGSAGDVSWGTTFLDHDNDGVLEIATAYGFMPTKGVGMGPMNTENREEQPDQLWTREGSGWIDVASDLGVDNVAWSRSVLAEDLDRDGFAELITWSIDEGPRIHRSGCTENAWLRVHLQDSRGANVFAVGARVRTRGANDRLVSAEVQAGGEGVLSGGPPEVRLGLGDIDHVDLVVRWSDGYEETFAEVPTRRSVTIRR